MIALDVFLQFPYLLKLFPLLRSSANVVYKLWVKGKLHLRCKCFVKAILRYL